MVGVRFCAVYMLLGVAVSAPVLGGCAAPLDSNAESASEDVRATLLGDVVAVRVNGQHVVAAPSKLRRVLENVGLQRGAPRPRQGAIRCLSTYHLEFLDASGATKATAGFLCGAPGVPDRHDAPGSLQVRGASYLITAKDVDAIDAIAAEPRAVGDVIFGADHVQISRPARPEGPVEIRDAAVVARLVKAVAGDQVPDPRAALPRCLPSRAVTYLRGDTELGSVSLACSEAERGVVRGAFGSADELVNGAVQVDAGAVFDAERAAQR